jgi:hypothetical protein
MTEHRIIKGEGGTWNAEVKREDGEWARWALGAADHLASVMRSNILGQRRRAAEMLREAEAMERSVSEWMAETGHAVQTRVVARYVGSNAHEEAAGHARKLRQSGQAAEAERGWVGWEVVAVTVVDLPGSGL